MKNGLANVFISIPLFDFVILQHYNDQDTATDNTSINDYHTVPWTNPGHFPHPRRFPCQTFPLAFLVGQTPPDNSLPNLVSGLKMTDTNPILC
jgi:hypothetical protein